MMNQNAKRDIDNNNSVIERDILIKKQNIEIERLKRIIQTRDLEIQNLKLQKQYEINVLK